MKAQSLALYFKCFLKIRIERRYYDLVKASYFMTL